MKPASICLLLILAAVVLSPLEVKAGTAQERAGELVQWRENCNDPDPDLRLAYIENAISSGDVSIQRICIRCAVESDNADIKNLGLRAAIASLKQITFTVELPVEMQAKLQRAGDNKDEIQSVIDKNRNEFSGYNTIKNGLSFIITEATVPSSQSIWFSLAKQSSKNDDFKGTATITGDRINWVGRSSIDRNSYESSISLKLEAGGVLKGTYQPSSGPVYPITAKLW
ncbi:MULTISPECIES: hypothetical protein [unclassified Pseudodesulfovibrio]|uniref:hypothetical protein n=1 Tax=unclassified Pseudodesulfovibrio TaxID=2661612 RepID=UPI000FEB94F3|nr:MULTISPECIES: hypothetical protein [unclassified Pseudodesulfovibrio]MCJ2164676.1 hypothetical protein [Pseudodesulfovibrio sp. S3-i]RWU04132.1 hypothetical protein DWB63_08995 [Pseudodesulfovibrio sp. S3]